MFRIKFQGESLETFFLYEVIQHDLSADLGVIGPPGPARSVTVKFIGIFWVPLMPVDNFHSKPSCGN